jgi:hypothetical protein
LMFNLQFVIPELRGDLSMDTNHFNLRVQIRLTACPRFLCRLRHRHLSSPLVCSSSPVKDKADERARSQANQHHQGFSSEDQISSDSWGGIVADEF